MTETLAGEQLGQDVAQSVGNRVALIAVGAGTAEEAQALARKLDASVRFATEPAAAGS
ncbi:hypothetical protein OG788_28140 [Streptomyces sp. NBC_00647]|uniref:hypothetical protein n=1 Tax=Streptomyces sp. NBC_00647 TaxID=2975796 RepID=UPI0032543896